jgi:hypothetical protein
MAEAEVLEVTMVIEAVEVILATPARVETRLLRQPQAEIRLESVNLSDDEE